MVSSYQVIDGDTIKTDSLKSDIIYFSEEKGVYPDSLKEEKEDFELTKKMSRFDDYQLADNAAFWEVVRADKTSTKLKPLFVLHIFQQVLWYLARLKDHNFSIEKLL